MLACRDCPEFGKHPFCGLSPESQAMVEMCAVEVEYPRRGVLFREGDRGRSAFVVCSGRVKLSVTSPDGRTLVMRVAGPGDVLGLSAVLAEGDLEVTAEALETTRVRVLAGRQLQEILLRRGDMGAAVAKVLAIDYRSALEEASLIALYGTARGRLARVILRAVEAGTEQAKRGLAPIKMALTHDELAGMLATSRETITRAMGELRRQRIIEIRGSALTVLNRDALERWAVA